MSLLVTRVLETCFDSFPQNTLKNFLVLQIVKVGAGNCLGVLRRGRIAGGNIQRDLLLSWVGC